MRYSSFSSSLFLWTLLSFSLFVHAQQPWSGILSPSRAIDWSHAGLPGSLPDGETTSNPWTPPVRTQCGSTLSPTATVHDINTALAACPSGTYVRLAGTNASPVTYNINAASGCYAGSDTCIQLYTQNGVSLRGGGPQATIIHLSGYAEINFGVTWNNASTNVSSGLSQGSTSVVVPSISGAGGLAVGELAYFNQCDSGYSGKPCTGTSTDNGALYVCGDNTACQSGSNSGTNNHQAQMVRITAITGSGPYTVSFSPGLYMPNWSTSQTATLNWESSTSAGGTAEPYGNGLEDLTVYVTGSSGNESIYLGRTYASWVKGVRVLGGGSSTALSLNSNKNCLVTNSYFFPDIAIDANYPPPVQEAYSSDDLVINNIMASGVPWEGFGSNSGDVLAYNYGRDTFSMYYENYFFEHHAGSSFFLEEGNQFAGVTEDDTWGAHDLNTFFRNYGSGWDAPYQTLNPRGFTIDAFARFDNIIGNAIGNTNASAGLTTYEATSGWNYVYRFGQGGPVDALAKTTSMRWGNCDTATNTCRFQGSEVPTTLSGNAVPFQNSVPGSTSLPASLFMNNATAEPNGGTGLSFWRVATAWTTFPTAPSATQTQPFPPVGPDVTGGPYVNGTAYDIPAAVAWKNLPIDPTYQYSYGITGSSWSNGIETLTVSGLPNTTHLMGGFQITGAGGCNSPTSGEFLMTGSSSTTISYAVASNPGNCAGGTMKFPDVRQFDEQVYLVDSGQGNTSPNQPPAPGGLTATVQ